MILLTVIGLICLYLGCSQAIDWKLVIHENPVWGLSMMYLFFGFIMFVVFVGPLVLLVLLANYIGPTKEEEKNG